MDFSTQRFSSGLSQCIAGFSLLALSSGVHSEVSFDINGFGSLGLSKASNDNVSYAAAPINDAWNENQDTKLAVQGSVISSNGLSGAIQVISRGRQDYKPKIEWLYGAYQIKPNFTVRLGRMRTPLYEFSDYLDLGISYPWVRPPMTVYASNTIASRYDGIDLQYNGRIGSWDSSVQASFGNSNGRGTIEKDAENVEFSLNNIMGMVLRVDKDIWGIRLGYLQSDHMSIESPGLEPLSDALSMAGFNDIARYVTIDDTPVKYSTAAISIDHEYWLMNSEIIHVSLEDTIVPSITFKYIMIGRHFGDLTLHYTYARKDMDVPSGTADPIYNTIAQLQQAGGSPQQIGGLSALAGGVEQIENSFEYKVYSSTLGARYAVTDMVSVKAELQQSTNHNNQSTNFISLSLDFLF